MKLKNFGRAAVALAASAVSLLGMTSCSLSYTVGYLFVTGAATGAGTQFGQIASYRIQNNNGVLRQSSIISSAGYNPVQAVVNSSGTYVYVLNQGCGNRGQSACPNGSTSASQIDLFSVGGSGVLTHQQTFTPQGTNTLSIQLSGNFLYALDEYAPDSSGQQQNVGDISAYSVDSTTGRLSPLLNTQVKDSNGQPLTYFPVGANPVWLSLGNGYAFIAEGGQGTASDPSQAVFIYSQNSSTGQLTLTESTPTPTGATQLTYVYANGSTLYALDAGTSDTLQNAGSSGQVGQILPYTIGTSGALTAISPAANNAQGQSPVFPYRVIKESSKNFLWVANAGINTNLGANGSVITAYIINSNGQLSSANTGSGSNGGTGIPTGASSRCIVEDPSNQYVYTVNYNDSTFSGKKINFNTGGLDALPKALPSPPGSPTWCAVTGSTF